MTPLSVAFAYITINISPVLLRLGPFTVRWYGLMYAVGLGLALWVTLPVAERRGVPRETAYSIFWGVTIAGLIGGRLYFVVQNDPMAYLAHPARILALWEGGMAFYGAIFLGVPVLYLLTRLYRVPFLPLLDTVALLAPLAQAVGRIGNIINGDIVGYPSTLPWATAYANPGAFARPLCTAPYTHCVAFQPAAAYELIFSAALFALLWRLRDRPWPAGMHFVAYLALYSLGQLVIFIWRDNVFVLGPLKQAQATAIVVLVALVPIALWLSRRNAQPRPAQERAVGAMAHDEGA
jgi:phosphatidylglycerol:prolipoprotein diacylglycerol transferase